MSHDLEFTGERFLPGIAGEIAHEHWHRYAFARRWVEGKRVLDVACGEGYGSALLSQAAGTVIGVDIAESAIDHARAAYATLPNLRFEHGSATALPLPDASIDVVVSFETIEHLPGPDQPRMVKEIARVLTADGVLVLSAPNPVEYSQARSYRNPFHPHEPTRDELDALLAPLFPVAHWYGQRRYFGSAIWNERSGNTLEAWSGDAAGVAPATAPAPMYFLVVAARNGAQPVAAGSAISLYTDRSEAELLRLDGQAAEVMRLDRLLGERDTALDRQTAHIHHLEDIATHRERLVIERDAQLKALNDVHEQLTSERGEARRERDKALQEIASAQQAIDALRTEGNRLERALAAQERIIAYRQSARWWLALPWLRVKLWWRAIGGR
jgi:ubiquinone/menaquinone biosynthesis C-methylase UbiE